MNRDAKTSTGESGFTLIELLIVIIILGVLAAIVVFGIGGTRGNAVAASCKTTVQQIVLAAQAVKNHQGTYGAATELADPAKGGLMRIAPPVVTGSFIATYAVTGAGTGFTITTTNPRGKSTLSAPGAYQDTDADSVIEAICKGA